MTMFYVLNFKKKHKCSKCNESTNHYSLCEKHLDYARKRFRKWSSIRKHQRLCCYCHRKSYKGFLRCKTHTMENRVRVKEWHKNHPEYIKNQYIRLCQLRDSGFCPTCPEHRPLESDYKRCDVCRERHRMYAAGRGDELERRKKNVWTWASRA